MENFSKRGVVMRLTNKNSDIGWNNKYYVKPSLFSENGMKAIDKLGQLEDIEDELGIDLFTLFKALKDIIYVKDDNEIKKAYPTLSHIKNEGYVFDVLCARIVKLCDYGKTWSLNKEEILWEKN